MVLGAHSIAMAQGKETSNLANMFRDSHTAVFYTSVSAKLLIKVERPRKSFYCMPLLFAAAYAP